MRLIYILFAFGFFSLLPAQSFTWMKGSNQGGLTANYGTLGLAAATNSPGCRHGSATWVDQQGNLWLFGGEGYDTTPSLCWLNDLWKYDIQSNQWTWMGGSNAANQGGTYGTQGVASASNQPGAREFMMSWTDAQGNFWLYGGDGFDGSNTFGKLGDLWKYNPASGQWTWMKGPNSVDQSGVYGTLGTGAMANFPGCRRGSAQWTDASGNLWLMGGNGYPASGPSGLLNDLWRYNIASNQWTWMSGSNSTAQFGVYGILNVASALNTPGAFEFPGFWFHNNDLYLFGGRGYAASGSPAYLNGLWKYSTINNQWTWIGGSNGTMSTGVYGQLGTSAASVSPGARMTPACWNDGNGKLWLFGGEGLGPVFSLGALNDLFCYSIGSGEWTWMKGPNSINQIGSYGTQGVPASSNLPGSRYYNSFWPYSQGIGWLMGGYGQASSGPSDNMEDLWFFTASCNPEFLQASPSQSLCSGNSATLQAISSSTGTISWFTLPSGGNAIGTGSNLSTGPLLSGGNGTVLSFYAETASCTAYPRSVIHISVAAGPTLSISGNSSVCAGASFVLTASGSASGYTWSTGSQSATITGTLSASTVFSVIGTASNTCFGQQSFSVQVNALPQINISGSNSVCLGSSSTLSVSGTAGSYTWSNGSNASSISIVPAGNSIYSVQGSDQNGCSNSASVAVSVLPLPPVTISSKTVICAGEQAVLNASGALSFTWSSGQNLSSITVSPQSTSVYTLSGTGNFGCINSTTFTVSVDACLGLEEQNTASDLMLYPNPGKTEIHLNWPDKIISRVLIYNNLGQVLMDVVPEENSLQHHLPSGIYQYVILAKDQSKVSGKLLVE